MLLGLGLCADGASRVVTRNRGGFLELGAGTLATGLVRPHVSLIVLLAVAAGFTLSRARGPARTTPGRAIFGALLFLVALFLFYGRRADGRRVAMLRAPGPAKYKDPATSGLAYPVAPGAQTINVDLPD